VSSWSSQNALLRWSALCAALAIDQARQPPTDWALQPSWPVETPRQISLARIARHVTTILITHRLADVRHADRISVLLDERLVEDGTHDQLMALGSRYAELFPLPAAGYEAT
jgi:hypothetical protein